MSERGFWASIKFLAIYASIFVHLVGRFVSAHEGINLWFEMMLGDSCVYWTRANIFWSMTHIFNKISLSNSSSWRTREIPQALHPSLHVPSFWFRHSIRNCFLYPRSKISQYMRERSENVQSKDAFLHCYYQTLRFLRLVVFVVAEQMGDMTVFLPAEIEMEKSSLRTLVKSPRLRRTRQTEN